ncbi:MAG: MFS transporter, partial [Verrucomicrobiota bacterium]|nr:MFS transporter [Verrucomicrobiota bacterium]
MNRNKWLRLLTFVPSITMIYMDQSVLPVALPVMQREFHVSAAALQWTVNAYLLGWTMFVILGGKIGDRIGHRTSYLIAMVCFTLFSAMCGLSPNIGLLICARGLQGIAGSFMVTSQIALISSIFPPHSRGRAIGLLVSIGSVFLILGPMIGGFLTDWLSWRWIFWINLPIALIGAFLMYFLVPHTAGTPGKIDLWGFLCFAVFAAFASLTFMQGEGWGWKSPEIVSSIAIALISLVLLGIREKTSKHPFLELNLFKRPIFAAININVSVCQFVAMIFVFRTVYTETILGYSPTNAGLITSISSLPVLFFSYVGGYLADKVSPKLPIILGYLGVISSFFWLGFMPTPSLAFYFPPLMLFGMGMT